MAFSNQPLDSNSIPIASVYVPGGGFIATGGSITTETDGQNNTSTSVNLNIHQVGDTVITGLAGTDNTTADGILKVIGALSNGVGYDEPRNNLDNITLINATNVTTNQGSPLQTNYNGKGVIVIFNMIDASASPSVTLEIDGDEPVTGVGWIMLKGTAITANGVYVYRVYPGLIPVANAVANDIVPRTWGVAVTANNANAATYKVCAVVMN